MIRKFLGTSSLVLYPPVKFEKYLPLSQNRARKNVVVTLSRIEPLKNLEIVFDIAKEVKTAKFVIAGTVHSFSIFTAEALAIGTPAIVSREIAENLEARARPLVKDLVVAEKAQIKDMERGIVNIPQGALQKPKRIKILYKG
jgi:hypothetical protein